MDLHKKRVNQTTCINNFILVHDGRCFILMFLISAPEKVSSDLPQENER